MSAVSEITESIGAIASPEEYSWRELSQKYSSEPQAIQKLVESFDIDFSDLNIDEHKYRIIEGYANTNAIDRVNDRVAPRAFEKSLKTYMENPILRYNHEKGKIIGHVFDARIDEKGLFIRAKINYGDEDADRIWKKIVQKSLRGLSVYGRIVKKQDTQDMTSGVTVKDVSEFDLQEIAVVDIPANQESLLRIVKKNIDVEGANMSMNTQMQNAPTPQKEVGNELLSSDNLVVKELKKIGEFQAKQMELMTTLTEAQIQISKQLSEVVGSMGNASAPAPDMGGGMESLGLSAEKSVGIKDLNDETINLISKILDENDEMEEKILSMEEELEKLRSKVTVKSLKKKSAKGMHKKKRMMRKADEDEEEKEMLSDDDDEEKEYDDDEMEKGEHEDDEEKEMDEDEEKSEDMEEEKRYMKESEDEEKEYSEEEEKEYEDDEEKEYEDEEEKEYSDMEEEKSDEEDEEKMSEDEEEKAEHEDEEKEYEETEEKIYRKKKSPIKRKSAPRKKKVRKDKTIEKVLKGHTKKGTDSGNSDKGQVDRDAIWKSLILGTSK